MSQGTGNIAWPFDDPEYIWEQNGYLLVCYLTAPRGQWSELLTKRFSGQPFSDAEFEQFSHIANEIQDDYILAPLHKGIDPVINHLQNPCLHLREIALFDWVAGRFNLAQSGGKDRASHWWFNWQEQNGCFTVPGQAMLDAWEGMYGENGFLAQWVMVSKSDNALRVLNYEQQKSPPSP